MDVSVLVAIAPRSLPCSPFPLSALRPLCLPQAGGSVAQVEVAVAATAPQGGGIAAAMFTDTNVSNIRKVIAAKLTESKTTVPHYYLTVHVTLDRAQVRFVLSVGCCAFIVIFQMTRLPVRLLARTRSHVLFTSTARSAPFIHSSIHPFHSFVH